MVGVQAAGGPKVEIRLLGELEIAVAGVALDLGGDKQRRLLAMLALARGQGVAADALAEELWGPRPGVEVTSALQNAVSRLRRAIAAAGLGIGSRSGAYVLEPGAAGLDVATFERLTADGRRRLAAGNAHGAAGEFRGALDVWRGPALGSFADRPFARAEAARLDEARLAAGEALADALLAAGRPEEAVEPLEAVVAAAPYREDAWGRLMLARYRTGRQADALRAYQDLRRTLADDLGLEPKPALRDLEARILAQSPDLDGPGCHGPPTDLRPPGSGAANPHNLPSAPDRFLGRAAELAELEVLLGQERMITLWGPGGAGKTRLSLELARRALPAFPDGAWFVGLAPIGTDDGVAPAVISALGMLADGSAPLEDELGRYLAPRRALLVLDNCEHVVDAAARLARALLERCPDVCVVTSSRELLGVPGELAWPVPSLSLPGDADDPASLAASDAVGLFVERARTAQPAFALTDANSAAVAEICRRLEGIPLALELAAARVRVLGVKGLAQRLDARLGVLTRGPRTADPRHQTLRSAVDWSYDLLPAAERELLNCLSVFAGSFDLAAAEAVGDAAADRAVGFEVLDLLSRLVDKSLVVSEETPDGDIRYRLLETIRQYAAEKLDAAGSTALVRRRHLEHYARHVALREVQWRYRDADMKAIHAEHENYRSALEWALSQRNAEAAVGLAADLYQYWVWSETVGAQAWLERSLQLADGTGGLPVVHAMTALAHCTRSPDLVRTAITMAEDVAPPATLVKYLVVAADVGGYSAEARAYLERGIRLSAEVGSALWTSMAYNGLAWFEMTAGRYVEAEACMQRAITVIGPDDASSTLDVQYFSTLALTIALTGDSDRAVSCSARAIDRARRLPLPGLLIIALARATAVAVITGRAERAAEVLREQLRLLRRVGTQRWVGEMLEFTAMLLEQTGRPGPAIDVLRDARAHRAERAEPHGGTIPAIRDALAACAVRLGEPADPRDAARAEPRPLDAVLLEALHALEN